MKAGASARANRPAGDRPGTVRGLARGHDRCRGRRGPLVPGPIGEGPVGPRTRQHPRGRGRADGLGGEHYCRGARLGLGPFEPPGAGGERDVGPDETVRENVLSEERTPAGPALPPSLPMSPIEMMLPPLARDRVAWHCRSPGRATGRPGKKSCARPPWAALIIEARRPPTAECDHDQCPGRGRPPAAPAAGQPGHPAGRRAVGAVRRRPGSGRVRRPGPPARPDGPERLPGRPPARAGRRGRPPGHLTWSWPARPGRSGSGLRWPGGCARWPTGWPQGPGPGPPAAATGSARSRRRWPPTRPWT